MLSPIASLSRLRSLPTSVVIDKARSHFWSRAEQRLPHKPPRALPLHAFWTLPTAASVPAAEQERCLHAADSILKGEARVFDTPVQLSGSAPDWQCDPFSGLTWPLVHHSRIDVLDLSRPSDARVVWEINRCQHLIPLAQAYLLTGEARYAAACLEQLDDWIARNPPHLGINWANSMEVAIRGAVWSWLLAALHGMPAIRSAHQARLAASLVEHAQHIDRHLEHQEHSGNHYLANALGLIVLGGVFRSSRQGNAWLRRGQAILESELPRQFYADGSNYEGSVAYHGLALEIGLLAQVALGRLGASLSQVSLERLERALEVTLALTRSDGTYPSIGDVDDGQILPLGGRAPRTQRHLLALGGALFNRADFADAGAKSVEEVRWLTGDEAVDRLATRTHQSIGRVCSVAFPQGGWFVQGDETHHLVVDCGEVGSLGRGGHGHADMLSFECFALGQPLVVDGGTYTYTGDPAARRRYRGTAQHNTLSVDDRETLEQADLWSFEQPAKPRLLHWSTDEEMHVFGGACDLPGQAVRHERWIVYDTELGAWLVDDRVGGSGVHHLVLRFHVPSTAAELLDDGALVSYPSTVGLCIQRIEGDWAKPRIDSATISPLYHRERPAAVVVFEGSAQLPARCLTALVPYEGQCPDRASIRDWARSRELPPGACQPGSAS